MYVSYLVTSCFIPVISLVESASHVIHYGSCVFLRKHGYYVEIIRLLQLENLVIICVKLANFVFCLTSFVELYFLVVGFDCGYHTLHNVEKRDGQNIPLVGKEDFPKRRKIFVHKCG